MKDMQNEIEGNKATELLLSLRAEQLQKQLQEAHFKTQRLGEPVEIILMQAPNPFNIVQTRKLVVSPKDWDGSIWGDSNNNSSDEDNSLPPA